jgi:putative phosphoribosyl transferase
VRFLDRADAGRRLAAQLTPYAGRPDVVVLGLPRGGMPVAQEISRALHATLDVFVVRKLGVPGQPELAMGAIASGGVRVLNEEVVHQLRIQPSAFESIVAREQAELERRERTYRGDRPALAVEGKTVIVVDDGLATGSTMRAALSALRRQEPERLVVAVPVGAAETCDELRKLADDVVCLHAPDQFYAVGVWYRDFSETSDQEVREILDQASGDGRKPMRKTAGQ